MSVDDVVLDEDLLGGATNGEKEKSNSSLNQHLYHSTGSISKLSTAPVPVVDLLKYTVNLLKSIPVGKTVRLGVQKPLPYPDAIDASPFGDEQHPNQRESSEEREQISSSRKQGNFKASSKSYHSLYHTKTVSSSNFSPVAKKRKQIRTKLTKKKVIRSQLVVTSVNLLLFESQKSITRNLNRFFAYYDVVLVEKFKSQKRRFKFWCLFCAI